MSSNAPSPTPSRKPKPVPERFQVAKTTLWFDRIMTKTIIGGGFTVIVAVFGILFFLLAVTIPLFQSADVEERQPRALLSGSGNLGPGPFRHASLCLRQREKHLLPGQNYREPVLRSRFPAGRRNRLRPFL